MLWSAAKLVAARNRMDGCFKKNIDAYEYPFIADENGQRPIQDAYSRTKGALQLVRLVNEHGGDGNKFVPADGWASSQENVTTMVVQHFPSDKEKILTQGILYLDKNGLPGQTSMKKPFTMLTTIGTGIYGEDPVTMQEKVMSSSVLVDGIAVSAPADLHKNDSKATEYEEFKERYHGPSMESLEEMIRSLQNLKCIIVLGEEMCKSLVDTSFLRKMLDRIDR